MSRLRLLSETAKKRASQTSHKLYSGKITAIKGPILYARLPAVALNDICTIHARSGRTLEAQVIGFQEDTVTLAPFDSIGDVSPGSTVTHSGDRASVRLCTTPGNVLSARGELLLSSQDHAHEVSLPVEKEAPNPLSRTPIAEQLITGISSIDLFCPIGYGQRLGLFAGPGSGKSTLLGMIARNADVDICVIALVGERGREVREFIDECLGEEGLARSIVVVSTSDEPPLRRRLAVQTATAIAEHHRDKGKKVLLLVDSLTRVARAIRDVNLTAGEFPVRHGYTPSVYTELPQLVERTGTNACGSITAIYSILTSGSIDMDPLADELKGLLDGHMILHADIANWGVRPALDITASLSRLTNKLTDEKHRKAMCYIQKLVNRLFADKDALLLGGIPDDELQRALNLEPQIIKLLNQKQETLHTINNAKNALYALANSTEEHIN